MGLGILLLAAVPTTGQLAPTAPPSSVPVDASGLPVPLAQQFAGLAATAAQLDARGASAAQRAEAHGTLGHLYFYYELLPDAAAAYGRAAAAQPGDFRWPYHLGVTENARGDWEAATRYLQAALRLAPEDPAARLPLHLRLGQLALDRGDAAGAESAYRRALALDGDSGAAWFGVGRAELSAGEAASAVTSLRRAVDLVETRAVAVRYALIQALRATGDLEAARREQEALPPHWSKGVLPPRFPDPLMDAAGRATALSSYSLVMGLAADRDALSDLQFYRFALGTLENLGGAAAAVANVLDTWPAERRQPEMVNRARLSYVLGGLEAAAGRPDEAVRRYRDAFTLDPGMRPARVQAGLLLERMPGRSDAAREVLRPAFPSDGGPVEDPEVDDPLYLSGRSTLAGLLEAGEPEAALAQYEVITERWPTEVTGHLGRARVLGALGRAAEARRVLEAALADPRVIDSSGWLAGTLEKLSAESP